MIPRLHTPARNLTVFSVLEESVPGLYHDDATPFGLCSCCYGKVSLKASFLIHPNVLDTFVDFVSSLNVGADVCGSGCAMTNRRNPFGKGFVGLSL